LRIAEIENAEDKALRCLHTHVILNIHPDYEAEKSDQPPVSLPFDGNQKVTKLERNMTEGSEKC
jgi:hypothetical protein